MDEVFLDGMPGFLGSVIGANVMSGLAGACLGKGKGWSSFGETLETLGSSWEFDFACVSGTASEAFGALFANLEGADSRAFTDTAAGTDGR